MSCPSAAPPAPPPSSTAILALRLLLLALPLLLLVSGPAGRAQADGARWQWPLPPPHEVVAPFDAPENPYGPGHRGIDIAVRSADAPVRAVEAGTVRFSGDVAGRGVVSVQHADGLISTYEPVSGDLEEGSAVSAGDVLGVIEPAAETSHCPGALCLHLGARRGEAYVDPLLLLGGRGPSVLLPWGDAAGATAGAPDPIAAPGAAAGQSAPAPLRVLIPSGTGQGARWATSA
ncbi:MAG TPA: M23 family metallopeptidase [Brachybacterium sp.]